MGYMMTHPGKKLMFMGGEIGQFREWDFEGQIEWFLLDYDSHAKFQRYAAELNHLYLRTPALWQRDDSWDGFQWIDPNNRDQSIISYRRIDNEGKEIIVAINFTPVVYEDYRIGVPREGVYKEIFNSDDERFGGSGVINTTERKSEARSWNYCENSIVMRMPPLAISIFECVKKTSATRKPQTESRTVKSKIIKK